MSYFLLLLILLDRPGDIRDVIHVDTIYGKQPCITRMNYYQKKGSIPEIGMKKIPKGSVLSCVPAKATLRKAEMK